PGQLSEQILTPDIAARARNLVAQRFGQGEMLEYRNDVRESFVEGQRVGGRRLRKPAVQSIEQRMGGLMADDVMRQAAENRPTRQIIAGGQFGSPEITEQQRLMLWAVIGVRGAQRVRVDAQSLDVLLLRLAVDLDEARRPKGAASQCPLKIVDRLPGHRISHLLMKLRVRLGGGEPVCGQQISVVEIDRSVAGPA